MSFIRFVVLVLMAAYFDNVIAQTIHDSFRLDRSSKTGFLKLGKTYSTSDSIKLDIDQEIDGIAITGEIFQPEGNSFVRIILKDEEDNEYAVLESSRLINDTDRVCLSDYCEETKYLTGIRPKVLLLYVENATISMASIKWRNSEGNSLGANDYKMLKEKIAKNRLNQVQTIVNRINANNKAHKRLWRAGVTDLALLPWKKKKRALNVDGSCPPLGFEYYSSGIFEIGEPRLESPARTASQFVDHFDWRNRHGINWMTSVKDQGNGYGCWAFAAVGLTEALVNLYYNRKIDYDLSEQEVISCTPNANNSVGGGLSDGLRQIRNFGVSEEASFPFSDSDEPCENKGTFNELVSFNDYNNIQYESFYESDSIIKYRLIHNGPLVSGFAYYANSLHSHAMVLVGYATIHAGDIINYYGDYNENPIESDTIQNGDCRIGRTYWIFKNSHGPNYPSDHNGYAYILFNDRRCFSVPSFAITPIMTENYTDSDIAITDSDGDGYYYWGIGSRPNHCPDWIPIRPDGDDSDYTKGYMDSCGILYDLSLHVNDVQILSENTNWSVKSYIYNNIVVPSGVTLSITNDITFYRGAKITLQGGTLIVDGGQLHDAVIDIDDSSGSVVRMINGGEINYLQDGVFQVPLGNELFINNGVIKN